MSSRSHLYYEIKLLVNVKKDGTIQKEHTIIICDLAGKEDIISSKKESDYIKFVYDNSIAENGSGPYSEQMEYLNSLNQKYIDSESNPIFSIIDGSLTLNLSETHPFILDLRGEGRMINATLENLQVQLKGNNNYMSMPLNEAYAFYKTQRYDYDRSKSRFNMMQNRIPFKPEQGGLAEQYKNYPEILRREFKVLGLPDITDDEIEDTDELKKWVDPSKLLENKIMELTKGSTEIEYQVLLAINLNDRSTTTDIEPVEYDIVKSKGGRTTPPNSPSSGRRPPLPLVLLALLPVLLLPVLPARFLRVRLHQI